MIVKLLEFSANHTWLVSAAIFITVALVVAEIIQGIWSAESLSPTRAILLINRRQANIVDLRQEKAFARKHIPGALHMAPFSVELLMRKLTSQHPTIFVTDSMYLPLQYMRQLRRQGFLDLYHLAGGMDAWERAKLPVIHAGKDIE